MSRGPVQGVLHPAAPDHLQHLPDEAVQPTAAHRTQPGAPRPYQQHAASHPGRTEAGGFPATAPAAALASARRPHGRGLPGGAILWCFICAGVPTLCITDAGHRCTTFASPNGASHLPAIAGLSRPYRGLSNPSGVLPHSSVSAGGGWRRVHVLRSVSTHASAFPTPGATPNVTLAPQGSCVCLVQRRLLPLHSE